MIKSVLYDIKNSMWLTLKSFTHDPGILILLVLGPLLYVFFYAMPLQPQIPTKVPVAIVDKDHSSLSRNIIRYASASPKIDPIVMLSENDARKAMWTRHIEGYLVIPPELKHDVSLNKKVNMLVYSDGSYALINKSVSYGFLESIGTISAGIEIKKLLSQGYSYEQANYVRSPINLELQAHYNVSEGYSSYIVPAVAILVLQQTLLIAIAMFVATLAEKNLARTSISDWIGRILAFSSVSWLIGLTYFGWVYYLQDFARAGNIPGAILFLIFFSPCISILGCLAGLLLKERERTIYVLVFMALPFYFMAGVSWPVEGMSKFITIIRWIVPSTASIQTSLHLNEMGSSIADIKYYLLNIFIIGVVAFVILMFCGLSTSPLKKETYEEFD